MYMKYKQNKVLSKKITICLIIKVCDKKSKLDA